MKLNEELFQQVTTLYFSTDREFEAPFEASEEGLHFEEDYETLMKVIPGLRSDKKYKYSINIEGELKPLYINEDILFWSGPNIAELLLCKLDNINYPAAFIAQEDITPDKIQQIQLSENDRQELEIIKSKEATETSFSEIFKFINKKGFNCISYLIYEGDRKTDRAIIVDTTTPFDYNSVNTLL